MHSYLLTSHIGICCYTCNVYVLWILTHMQCRCLVDLKIKCSCITSAFMPLCFNLCVWFLKSIGLTHRMGCQYTVFLVRIETCEDLPQQEVSYVQWIQFNSLCLRNPMRILQQVNFFLLLSLYENKGVRANFIIILSYFLVGI